MITCEFENGNKAHLRHVCATMIIVDTTNDSILLTKRAPHLIQGGLWCLPGGYMELNQSVVDAARREALEETGYEVTILGLVGITDNPERGDSGRQNVVCVFAARAEEKKSVADAESSEQQWFPFDGLPKSEEWAFDHLAMVNHYRTQGIIPHPPENIFTRFGGALV